MRPAERLTRTPREWVDRQTAERRRILVELERELARAAESGAPWYQWIVDRQQGRHRHELVDEGGRAIACPVAGCAALASCARPHTLAGARSGRG